MWADGQMIRFEDATMHVLSHATQRGSAVFDVINILAVPTADGSATVPHALGLNGHVARFVRSMKLMGMDSDYTVDELEAAVVATVVANPGAGVVKLVAAWNEIPLRTLPITTTPHVWIAAMVPDQNADAPPVTGVKLQTASCPKMPASILPPSLKVAASYTAGVRQRMAAVADGFDDVVFKTADGDLAEGTTQSLSVITGSTLAVPPLDDVLDSITRQMMLEVATHQGLTVEVRTVPWSEVMAADELFLSSANLSALPVSCIDDQEYPSPGPHTQRLMEAADSLAIGQHELSDRWLTPMA